MDGVKQLDARKYRVLVWDQVLDRCSLAYLGEKNFKLLSHMHFLVTLEYEVDL